MKLFKYEDYNVVISEEAMCIKAFRTIWRRDHTMSKDMALRELGYVYFMADPRSDFSYITDEKERSEAIKEQEGFPKTWHPDKYLTRAIGVYRELTQTVSSRLLEDLRLAIDKARKFLIELDLTATDENGKPKYTLNQYVGAIKDIPKIIKELSEVEKVVEQELKEIGVMRGGKTKKLAEDGFEDLF